MVRKPTFAAKSAVFKVFPMLGDSLVVELWILTPAAVVRIHVPQPIFLHNQLISLFFKKENSQEYRNLYRKNTMRSQT